MIKRESESKPEHSARQVFLCVFDVPVVCACVSTTESNNSLLLSLSSQTITVKHTHIM